MGKPPIRGLNHLERFCRLDRQALPKASTDAPSGAVAVKVRSTSGTKQQDFDALLDYDVAIPLWCFAS